MTVIQIPSSATVSDALARLAGFVVVRVVLYRGPDGHVRGSAVVR